MKSFEGFVNESYPIQTRMEFPALVAINRETGKVYFVDLDFDGAMARAKKYYLSKKIEGKKPFFELEELFDIRRVKVEDLTKYPYNLTQEDMDELMKNGRFENWDSLW